MGLADTDWVQAWDIRVVGKGLVEERRVAVADIAVVVAGVAVVVVASADNRSHRCGWKSQKGMHKYILSRVSSASLFFHYGLCFLQNLSSAASLLYLAKLNFQQTSIVVFVVRVRVLAGLVSPTVTVSIPISVVSVVSIISVSVVSVISSSISVAASITSISLGCRFSASSRSWSWSLSKFHFLQVNLKG